MKKWGLKEGPDGVRDEIRVELDSVSNGDGDGDGNGHNRFD